VKIFIRDTMIDKTFFFKEKKYAHINKAKVCTSYNAIAISTFNTVLYWRRPTQIILRHFVVGLLDILS